MVSDIVVILSMVLHNADWCWCCRCTAASCCGRGFGGRWYERSVLRGYNLRRRFTSGWDGSVGKRKMKIIFHAHQSISYFLASLKKKKTIFCTSILRIPSVLTTVYIPFRDVAINRIIPETEGVRAWFYIRFYCHHLSWNKITVKLR